MTQQFTEKEPWEKMSSLNSNERKIKTRYYFTSTILPIFKSQIISSVNDDKGK